MRGLYEFMYINRGLVYFTGTVIGLMVIIIIGYYEVKRLEEIKESEEAKLLEDNGLLEESEELYNKRVTRKNKLTGYTYVSILIYTILMALGLMVSIHGNVVIKKDVITRVNEEEEVFYKNIEDRLVGAYREEHYVKIINTIYKEEYNQLKKTYPYTRDMDTVGYLLGNEGRKGADEVYKRFDDTERSYILSIDGESLEHFTGLKLAYLDTIIEGKIKGYRESAYNRIANDREQSRENLINNKKQLRAKYNKEYQLKGILYIQAINIGLAIIGSFIIINYRKLKGE